MSRHSDVQWCRMSSMNYVRSPLSCVRFALIATALASASAAIAGHGNPFSHASDWGAWAFADPTSIIDGGDGVALAQTAGSTGFTSAQASSDASLAAMTTIARADLVSPPLEVATVRARTSYYDTYEIVSTTLAPGTAVSFDVSWTHSGFYGTTESGESGNVAAQSEFSILIWSGGCGALGCGTPLSPAWTDADNTQFTGAGATVFDNNGAVLITTLQVGDHFGILADLHAQARALTFGLTKRGYSIDSGATIDFATDLDFSIAQSSPLPSVKVPTLPAGWGWIGLVLLLMGFGLAALGAQDRRMSWVSADKDPR